MKGRQRVTENERETEKNKRTEIESRKGGGAGVNIVEDG